MLWKRYRRPITVENFEDGYIYNVPQVFAIHASYVTQVFAIYTSYVKGFHRVVEGLSPSSNGRGRGGLDVLLQIAAVPKQELLSFDQGS